MKLEMTEGCVCWSYTVDDREFTNLSLNEKKELIKSLVDKTTDEAVLQGYFRNFLHTYGKHEGSDEPCDCCGDYIDTYTYEDPEHN